MTRTMGVPGGRPGGRRTTAFDLAAMKSRGERIVAITAYDALFASLVDAAGAIVRAGIPVMGHLGFTPQAVHALGGHRVQGRDEEAAPRLIEEAVALEEAGVCSIVLELMPTAAARGVTEAVSVPTIGIGDGG